MVILKLTAIGMVKLMDFQMERLKHSAILTVKLTGFQMERLKRWDFGKAKLMDWLKAKRWRLDSLKDWQKGFQMAKLMEIR